MFAGLAILLLAGCALLVIDGHNLSNIWANGEISYLGKLDLTQGILVDFSGCQSQPMIVLKGVSQPNGFID